MQAVVCEGYVKLRRGTCEKRLFRCCVRRTCARRAGRLGRCANPVERHWWRQRHHLTLGLGILAPEPNVRLRSGAVSVCHDSGTVYRQIRARLAAEARSWFAMELYADSLVNSALLNSSATYRRSFDGPPGVFVGVLVQ